MTSQMPDLIQCGDALWISCATWLVFWNGLIGALFAAVLAAGVAMLVVWLTTKHQTSLASAEAERQDDRAMAQLEAQRIGLESQMKEQREGLELQLREQREEASKGRELLAIADLLAEAMVLSAVDPSDGEGLIAVKDRMNSAALRWGLENDDPGMSREVVAWNIALFGQAVAVIEAHYANDEIRRERNEILGATYGVFMNVWTAYPTATADVREVNWEWMRAAVADPKPRTNDELEALLVESAKKVRHQRLVKKAAVEDAK